MKITDQQLARFVDMTKDFARKHGLNVEIETGLDMCRTHIRMSRTFREKKYTVCWSEVRSLTEAGTSVFADAVNTFNLSGGASSTPQFDISNVIYNYPATIVIWADGTKTVVKCQEGDEYSKEVGLALCFAKKALGNKGNFNNVFKKWVPEEKIEPAPLRIPELNFDGLSSLLDKWREAWLGS